ncbi:alanine racemase [Lapillicoccus jejuensis]|uniref:D-serine deaminase-like pyridoxal phosphate-dependent protein n=1 Tax=Lapillicoccus jejuensis TaxID=402171 RepID=A0A542E4C0_9MICO|nr:alanine racemase [Lapillicoccus jejuensis]TQJ10198.1 D-serine deaminase-like pyridoxal phosphate-dependent protein [Lapillicoccus jejuensis]
MSDAAPYDVAAVAALDDEVVDERSKAIPPSLWGLTVAQVRERRPRLAELSTPVLTLDRGALTANRDAVAAWCAERGLGLAPHGKTTMAPRLWAEQLDAGAWGITVATGAQLAVARRFGVRRVLVANELLSPGTLRWLADDLAAHPDVEVVVWVDSLEAVALMEDALAGARGPTVLVELGRAGARTGARDLETAVAVARALVASPVLRLGGVGGYEGVVASGAGADDLAAVRAYVEDLRALHERLDAEQAYDALRAGGRRPLVTCGGSAYPDVVAEVLAPLAPSGADVVLRSGASLVHDDGHYEGLSPFGGDARGEGPRLRAAMHAWARVLSQPEPGLALADAGKRDVPFDLGLPTVQRRRARPDEPVGDQGVVRLEGVAVTALADQHAFLRWDAGTPAPVRVGDVVRLGLSHPCTAFDRWSLIPVVDDADAADPVVVDLVRTLF